MDEDELELLDPPPPPPPPPPWSSPPLDEELELLELLDGVEDDELEDEVLEVLGAGALDELELLGVEELEDEAASGPAGLPFSHPMVAARPRVMAPPLRSRRKSRRCANAFWAASSIFRSLWLDMPGKTARRRPLNRL